MMVVPWFVMMIVTWFDNFSPGEGWFLDLKIAVEKICSLSTRGHFWKIMPSWGLGW